MFFTRNCNRDWWLMSATKTLWIDIKGETDVDRVLYPPPPIPAWFRWTQTRIPPESGISGMNLMLADVPANFRIYSGFSLVSVRFQSGIFTGISGTIPVGFKPEFYQTILEIPVVIKTETGLKPDSVVTYYYSIEKNYMGENRTHELQIYTTLNHYTTMALFTRPNDVVKCYPRRHFGIWVSNECDPLVWAHCSPPSTDDDNDNDDNERAERIRCRPQVIFFSTYHLLFRHWPTLTST